MLCTYGCGQSSKFKVTAKQKDCCSESYKQCPAVKQKNSAGLKKAHADGTKGYTYNPASNCNKGKNLVSNEEVFVEGGKHTTEFLKNRIVKDSLLIHKCVECDLGSEWNGKPIVLELDHINGVNNDNRLENLRFLCPNCHSQTPTFRGRGNTGKTKVTDEQLLTAYATHSNIRQTLIAVGLAPKGGNYTRMMRLIEK